jgi:benzoyl-CoA reductase/2-hydroxyglutaryl-CoA dehydratase subunit BcrC/BadD/HgdB
MINFLEEKSGRRMDWDRLAEIIARMDRQIELFREINELRKAVPTPFHFQGFLELLTTDYLFPGQPEAIDYLETLRDELVERVGEGKGVVANERFRLMTRVFWRDFSRNMARWVSLNPSLPVGERADLTRPGRWRV